MKLIGLLVVVLVSVFALPAISDKPADSIQGTWVPSVAELAGNPFPDEVRKSITLVIKDDQYTVTLGQAVDKGTLKINDTASPKEIDITGAEGPNKGRTIPAIYERTGDTLKICYDLSGQSHPKEFKTAAGTQLFLVTYQLTAPTTQKSQ